METLWKQPTVLNYCGSIISDTLLVNKHYCCCTSCVPSGEITSGSHCRMKAVSHRIICHLPSFKVIADTRYLSRVKNVLKESPHDSHHLLEILPLGIGAIKALRNSLLKRFFPIAVKRPFWINTVAHVNTRLEEITTHENSWHDSEWFESKEKVTTDSTTHFVYSQLSM